MELLTASRQWATRPDDESFESLAALHDAVSGHRADAGVSRVPFGALRTTVEGGDVALIGNHGTPAPLTHWAFGQLSARADAPASYLRELPAPLAAECINTGLAKRTSDEPASLLFHRNGSLLCRAITSERYTRIWNSDITSRLVRLAEHGPWQPAPAAMDGKRGLYASDHDMFAFLVDDGRRVMEHLPGGGLSRGFFVWNSEVGAASFGVCTFLYEYICGNHIVWGAKGVRELRIRHIGNADARAFRNLAVELHAYAESSASDEEARIERAMRLELGTSKDEVLDKVFGLRVPMLSRKRAEDAYTLAESRSDWYGSPRTAWGFANGVTELSQRSGYADERVTLDRAAGKVLELAF